MNKRQKLRTIRKICRSTEDWHVNAAVNMDFDDFCKFADAWCITRHQKFGIYLDRQIYKCHMALDRKTRRFPRKRRRQ